MTTRSQCAIAFPDPKPTSGAAGTIYGIEVAIRTLTQAWMRYTQQEHIYVLPDKPSSHEVFASMAAAAGVSPERLVVLSGANLERIKTIDTVFHPDPMMLNSAWFRVPLPKPSFALCALAHTMTGKSVAEVVAGYVTFPTQRGDAIICPSTAIRDSIKALLNITEDYYNHRFGLTGAQKFSCPVNLPVLPLGINTADFAARVSPAKRAAQRAALGIKDDEVVVLFYGRLSYFSKSHPLPLLLAIERAAQQARAKNTTLRLVMYGYFSPANIEPDYRALVRDMCPTAQVDIILRDDPRFPDAFWAGADMFTSLVDNYQESFGLTPIEAMAAGLPSVITNWNGYRDGVRHGIDGFQVDTVAPPAGAGMQMAFQYANSGDNYSDYLAGAAQSVAVDIDMAAVAFALLATNPDKRLQMGRSAQARASSTYDWRVLIPQYEALWHECATKRKTFAEPAVPPHWPAVHTSCPDPYAMFASFPTRTLGWDDVIVLTSTAADVEKVLSHGMNCVLPDLLIPLELVIGLLAVMRDYPDGLALKTIYADLAKQQIGSDAVLRTVGWMLKNGFVRLVPPLA